MWHEKRSVRVFMDLFQTKSFSNIFLILSRFLRGVAGNLAPWHAAMAGRQDLVPSQDTLNTEEVTALV